MADTTRTQAQGAAAPQDSDRPDMPDRSPPPPPKSAAAPWLSLLAIALALAAIALTQFDFRTPPASKATSNTGERSATAERDGSAGDRERSDSPAPQPNAAASASEAPSSLRRSGPPSTASRVRLLETQIVLPLEALRQEAEQVAQRLEKRYADKPESLHVAALFYAQTRQTAEAEKRWKRCIELVPQVEMYYINLAALSMERGDNELAVKTLKQGLDAGFASPALMHHWGLALSNAGRFEEAIPVIEKSIAEEPNNAAEWLMLGKAQLETGDLDAAEKSLRKSIELGMKTAGAYFALGTTYARQGKREQAKEFLKLYEENRPNKNDSTEERLEELNLNEMRQTAILVLSEAANVYLQADDALDAEQLLLRTLAIDPQALGPARTLARLYFDKKMLPEERVVRERILKIDPYNFGNYVDCAKVYAQLDDMPSAEAVLKLAMTQRPEAVEPYATLAEFYWQAKALPEARWFAEQAVERQPRSEGYRLLAAICEAQKDAERYRQAVEQAQSLAKPKP